MNFSLKKLTDYCLNHSSSPTDILKELERETNLKTLAPQMISGPLQGLLLTFISKMIKPKSILEIGTFTGYSTICLAQGLAEGGKLITIDSNRELKSISEDFFNKAGIELKVEQRTGDAKKIIPELDEKFDLVLIDAGKQDYALYYDLVIEKVNSGGFILADNVLWSGKVTQEIKDNDTTIIDDFNNKIKDDDRVEKLMLPIRDGITLIMKK